MRTATDKSLRVLGADCVSKLGPDGAGCVLVSRDQVGVRNAVRHPCHRPHEPGAIRIASSSREWISRTVGHKVTFLTTPESGQQSVGTWPPEP